MVPRSLSFKKSTTLVALTASSVFAGSADAGLFINAGKSSGTGALVANGQGPTGSDTAYQAFAGGDHETTTTGNLQTFTGITFAGAAGTYNVGVEFTWPDTTANSVKQAFGRPLTNDVNFFETWMGADSRNAQGGNGNSADTTTRLSFTGLPTDTSFTLTSYHFDNDNQTGLFITNLTGSTTFDIGAEDDAGFADDGNPDPLGFQYDFTLTSDESGNASIDYKISEGTTEVSFFVINGFDLVAVPEPGSLALLG